MLDTVVISGDGIRRRVATGILVDVFVFSVMWSELLLTSASHVVFEFSQHIH